MLTPDEYSITIDCLGSELLGIIHPASQQGDFAAVIVVGGPQYRVGSHRMFVELARTLAEGGVPVLRFDCRGMGDSDGTFASFEDIAADIRAAVDAATKLIEVRDVVLIGLCDGASACALYGSQDSRVRAMVLMNPWVRSQSSEAKARVAHYYSGHMREWSFWRRLFTGDVNVARSATSLLRNLWMSLQRRSETQTNYVVRMYKGIEGFTKSILVLLSSDDLTAQEFKDLVRDSPNWKEVVRKPNVMLVDIAGADHTFSGAGAIEQIGRRIVRFGASLSQ